MGLKNQANISLLLFYPLVALLIYLTNLNEMKSLESQVEMQNNNLIEFNTVLIKQQLSLFLFFLWTKP